MTVAVGTSFEFPLVLVILVWVGVLTTKTMRSNRRIVFVIIMVAAALITPGGDPISLSLLTLPMYFLYEMAIFLAKRSSDADLMSATDMMVSARIAIVARLRALSSVGSSLARPKSVSMIRSI